MLKLNFLTNYVKPSMYKYQRLIGKNVFKYFADKPSAPAGTTTPVTTGSAGQVSQQTAPPKTKEQLKVEQLMEQWPERVRNPPKEDVLLNVMKERLEETYKYHQGDKAYLKRYDIPHLMDVEITNELGSSLTTDKIIDTLKNYEGFVSDNDIAFKFLCICNTHKDLTPDFYNYLLPLLKKLLAKADRHSNYVIAKSVIGAATIGLADKEFWNIVEFKLVNERLYRYIEIADLFVMVNALVNAEKGSRELFKLMEVTFIKQRKALAIMGLTDEIERLYKVTGHGSDLLYQAMADPTIEIPAIDSNNGPKMDKHLKKQHLELDHSEARLLDEQATSR